MQEFKSKFSNSLPASIKNSLNDVNTSDKGEKFDRGRLSTGGIDPDTLRFVLDSLHEEIRSTSGYKRAKQGLARLGMSIDDITRLDPDVQATVLGTVVGANNFDNIFKNPKSDKLGSFSLGPIQFAAGQNNSIDKILYAITDYEAKLSQARQSVDKSYMSDLSTTVVGLAIGSLGQDKVRRALYALAVDPGKGEITPAMASKYLSTPEDVMHFMDQLGQEVPAGKSIFGNPPKANLAKLSAGNRSKWASALNDGVYEVMNNPAGVTAYLKEAEDYRQQKFIPEAAKVKEKYFKDRNELMSTGDVAWAVKQYGKNSKEYANFKSGLLNKDIQNQIENIESHGSEFNRLLSSWAVQQGSQAGDRFNAFTADFLSRTGGNLHKLGSELTRFTSNKANYTKYGVNAPANLPAVASRSKNIQGQLNKLTEQRIASTGTSTTNDESLIDRLITGIKDSAANVVSRLFNPSEAVASKVEEPTTNDTEKVNTPKAVPNYTYEPGPDDALAPDELPRKANTPPSNPKAVLQEAVSKSKPTGPLPMLEESPALGDVDKVRLSMLNAGKAFSGSSGDPEIETFMNKDLGKSIRTLTNFGVLSPKGNGERFSIYDSGNINAITQNLSQVSARLQSNFTSDPIMASLFKQDENGKFVLNTKSRGAVYSDFIKQAKELKETGMYQGRVFGDPSTWLLEFMQNPNKYVRDTELRLEKMFGGRVPPSMLEYTLTYALSRGGALDEVVPELFGQALKESIKATGGKPLNMLQSKISQGQLMSKTIDDLSATATNVETAANAATKAEKQLAYIKQFGTPEGYKYAQLAYMNSYDTVRKAIDTAGTLANQSEKAISTTTTADHVEELNNLSRQGKIAQAKVQELEAAKATQAMQATLATQATQKPQENTSGPYDPDSLIRRAGNFSTINDY